MGLAHSLVYSVSSKPKRLYGYFHMLTYKQEVDFSEYLKNTTFKWSLEISKHNLSCGSYAIGLKDCSTSVGIRIYGTAVGPFIDL